MLPGGPVPADAAEVFGAGERRVVGRGGPRPLLRRSSGGRPEVSRVLQVTRGIARSPSISQLTESTVETGYKIALYADLLNRPKFTLNGHIGALL